MSSDALKYILLSHYIIHAYSSSFSAFFLLFAKHKIYKLVNNRLDDWISFVLTICIGLLVISVVVVFG